MNRVQRFRRGQRLANMRDQLNDLVARANRDSRPGGPAGTAPGFLPQPIVYVEIQNTDVPALGKLECVFPGQALNPSARVYVVTPPSLITATAHDGVSYVYTNINERVADGTENQALTPKYIIGDMLMIGEFEQGVAWRDLNIDGRQWAKVP